MQQKSRALCYNSALSTPRSDLKVQRLFFFYFCKAYALLLRVDVTTHSFRHLYATSQRIHFLVQAVRGGCLGLLQDLTEDEVGQRDEYGFTALMYNALLYEEILDPILLNEAGIRSGEESLRSSTHWRSGTSV